MRNTADETGGQPFDILYVIKQYKTFGIESDVSGDVA
jgi:hypothetical protein